VLRAGSKGGPHEILGVMLSALAFAIGMALLGKWSDTDSRNAQTTETDNVETAERPLVAPHLEAAAAHAGLLGRAGRIRDADHRRAPRGPQPQRHLGGALMMIFPMHPAKDRRPGCRRLAPKVPAPTHP
jgi:hypothetical protein